MDNTGVSGIIYDLLELKSAIYLDPPQCTVSVLRHGTKHLHVPSAQYVVTE